MIGIRAITYNLTEKQSADEYEKIRKASLLWLSRYRKIHTQRVTLCPKRKAEVESSIDSLIQFCDTSDIRWYDIPIDPWDYENKEELFNYAEKILKRDSRCFVNVLAIKEEKIDGEIIKGCISLIKRVAIQSNNGKDNFRLGCSVNVKGNGAFFPFTYSEGELGFSLGLELIEDINDICQRYKKATLVELRKAIIEKLYPQIKQINEIAEEIACQTNIKYFGIDLSIAPMISKMGSVLNLLTRLEVYNFGGTGTLFATSFFTDMLKDIGKSFKTVGFSGVMYSVLEDLGICMINNEKGINLDDLIKCSTMCGCGVDMLPVPIDITAGEIYSLFKDIYAISTRLHKPLGIRLLPIPTAYRRSVHYTDFSDDADFIANTKVLKLDGNTCYMNEELFSYLG